MLEKDKDSFPSHLNYDLIELPTELFQVSKKNKKALAELGSDAKRMNSGLKKKGKLLRSCPSWTSAYEPSPSLASFPFFGMTNRARIVAAIYRIKIYQNHSKLHVTV